ncbi:MAG: glycosyltransferase [Bacteroidaceae bacterium]|nr:glycosyltransferase [Bacteroidaceae bacterium]
MRVLLVSTSERSGGGAIAARRLMNALNRNGVEAKLMVRDKQSNDNAVVKVGNKLPKFLERLAILPRCCPPSHLFTFSPFHLLRSRLWQIDIANVGIDITKTKEFKEADVIHLHWINQGMLSLDGLERIMSSGKRVVWTLHDEWPYLGVCHYRGDCTEKECKHCPLMSGSLPYTIYARKRAMYQRWHPTFVGCSQWITDEARRALPSERVEHINNCIPSALFHPTDMQQARQSLALPQDKRLLLFCSQKVTDERKGIKYLVEALRKTLSKDPSKSPLKGETSCAASSLPLREGWNRSLVIVGKDSEQIPLPDDIPVFRFGSVNEEMMAKLYNAADVFLTPSLQDNLPNTIAEAMSCGTPCVGFNVGGIPEMIDHLENGYVARYRDAADLAEGIRYVLSHDLRAAAHSKAAAAYDETQVAKEYIKLFSS